jgi:hypothetical protein
LRVVPHIYGLDVEVAGTRSKNEVVASGEREWRGIAHSKSIDYEEKPRMDEREKMRGGKGTYRHLRATSILRFPLITDSLQVSPAVRAKVRV